MNNINVVDKTGDDGKMLNQVLLVGKIVKISQKTGDFVLFLKTDKEEIDVICSNELKEKHHLDVEKTIGIRGFIQRDLNQKIQIMVTKINAVSGR